MKLCGLKINCTSFKDIIDNLNKPRILITVNAEAIVRAQKEFVLRKIINDNLASLDGQIPLWLFNHLYKKKIEKISGSDLIFSLSEWAANHNKKIFLLGGKEDSNRLSISNLSNKYSNLIIDGYSPSFEPYPFSKQTSDEIIQKIKKLRPHIVFVGFGMGKQEYWAKDNFSFLEKIGVKLIIGCGGSFDFAAGKIKRAPIWVQRSGLESIWRLFKEFKWFRIKRILLSLKIFYYYYQYHVNEK